MKILSLVGEPTGCCGVTYQEVLVGFSDGIVTKSRMLSTMVKLRLRLQELNFSDAIIEELVGLIEDFAYEYADAREID